MPLDVVTSILYILLGAVAGVVYSLRRMFILEKKIDFIDEKLLKILKKVQKEEEEELSILRRRSGKDKSKSKGKRKKKR